MASTLYVETNYAVGFAKGQDPHGDFLSQADALPFRLVIPCVCFMEALTVLNSETKARNRFLSEMDAQIREASRDGTSENARALVRHLSQARASAEGWLQDFRTRLSECLFSLSRSCEIIPLDPGIGLRSMEQPILDEPTDRLILHSILWHAEWAAPGPKAFLSGNSGDFAQPAALDALKSAGIHYFARSEAAIGWIRSQTDA